MPIVLLSVQTTGFYIKRIILLERVNVGKNRVFKNISSFHLSNKVISVILVPFVIRDENVWEIVFIVTTLLVVYFFLSDWLYDRAEIIFNNIFNKLPPLF